MSVATNPQILEVNSRVLKEKLDQGSIVLVDVREPSDYKGERIAGSVNVPLSRFQASQLPAVAADQLLVLSCQSGNRSGHAAKKLLDVGYDSVTHLAGGINSWKAEGYRVQTASGGPLPMMRQVQITAGSLMVVGTLLGAFVSPWWLLLSGFVGSGLVFAGLTGTCALAMVLAKMPWNQG
ncbi:MAG: rhodanese-like domain-containing protein [Synechococcaceae cyanobacterium RM1_1_27]|nr:rhodanese-like domain-containing protein [Synechococcaceae cyanobacterium SM2_3_2]NJO85646.1 rhodanese-like domain-containing protein [Synechococcaceae cyanobacterium RM1_1_27]